VSAAAPTAAVPGVPAPAARPSLPRRLLRGLGRLASLALWAAFAALLALVAAGLVSKAVMGSGQPVVFGWSCASVLTGSMEPGISPGDLVVSRALGSYSEGDVVTYLTETGSSVTHRVVAVSDEGLLTTRGDANNADDSLPVDPANVVGAVVLVVPGAGTALGWLATPAGAASAAALVAALLFLWWAVTSGGRGKAAAPEGAGGLPAGAGGPEGPEGSEDPAGAAGGDGEEEVRTCADRS
jgi:signal peptidase